MKIVKVEWEDIIKQESLTLEEGIKLDTYIIEDIGYLIYEDDDKVILCSHYCKTSPESPNNDCIVIPKSVVKKIEVK